MRSRSQRKKIHYLAFGSHHTPFLEAEGFYHVATPISSLISFACVPTVTNDSSTSNRRAKVRCKSVGETVDVFSGATKVGIAAREIRIVMNRSALP